MGANGPLKNGSAAVLQWPGRLLAAEDVRRALNGHHEVVIRPETVVTPLAADELRTHGVPLRRALPEPRVVLPRRWGQAADRPYPLVASAVQAVEREGIPVGPLPGEVNGSPGNWARAIAECIARGDCCGGVIFCNDPGLVCCVANKVTGLRAVPVVTVSHAARATLTLGANLLAVEMPGRTFFELRQILRLLCCADSPACPEGVACTLQELDGHAHR